MLVFISGSINSGKTTTARALARKLSADFVNVDDLNDTIPNFNLATDLDKSMDYRTLCGEVPGNVVVGYDGLEVEL